MSRAVSQDYPKPILLLVKNRIDVPLEILTHYSEKNEDELTDIIKGHFKEHIFSKGGLIKWENVTEAL